MTDDSLEDELVSRVLVDRIVDLSSYLVIVGSINLALDSLQDWARLVSKNLLDALMDT